MSDFLHVVGIIVTLALGGYMWYDLRKIEKRHLDNQKREKEKYSKE